MARRQEPAPGKFLISVIYSSLDALSDCLDVMEKKFGRVKCETLEIPCSNTEVYREEMGDDLIRRFFSFEKDVDRSTLPELKAFCSKTEYQFSDIVDDFHFRCVNIDPIIQTPDNIVVASHHETNYNIYVKDGVYAEIALIYGRGQYLRLPWTNADYYHDEAIDFFNRVRLDFELIDTAKV